MNSVRLPSHLLSSDGSRAASGLGSAARKHLSWLILPFLLAVLQPALGQTAPATGGTITQPSPTTYVHTFTSSGTFAINVNAGSYNILIVAGGGGGGLGCGPGGALAA